MARRRAAGLMLAGLAALATGAAPPAPPPFRDPDLPAGRRIDDLLSRMTTDEKIDALSTDSGVPRLGVPSFGSSEGIHGLQQRGAPEKGRAPITTTQFPQPPGMGATWDPALVREAAGVQGLEARYISQTPAYGRQVLMNWGPQADLARDPRWGRSEEVYGEDPFLAGSMTTAFSRGLEGDDARYWQVAPLLKHFLANSNENGRTHTSSNFDDRLFWEYYSVPFRMAFQDAGAKGVMAAYNAWNGVPMAVNPVLRRVVIDRWGVDVVSSDGGAVKLLVTAHKRFATKEQAVAATLKAGINQYLDTYKDEMRQALKDGLVTTADLDEALRRKFRTTLRLGLLDPAGRVPYAGIGAAAGGPPPWDGAHDRDVSLRMALESVVLLKNAHHALPLGPARLRSLAVIGPLADAVHWDWYGGYPPYAVTPLAGLRAALGPGVRVTFARDDAGGAATRAARGADAAVVVVGNDPTCGPDMAHAWNDEGTKPCADPGDGREGRDRVTLALSQEALARRVLAANPRTVMVLVSSFPYTINWSQAHMPAIVQMAHASQDEGRALADVLLGRFDPGGHTTATWPASEADLPPMLDYDIRHGRTYMYARARPLYPFGFGLSYTTFRYAHLRIDRPRLAPGDAAAVSVDVTNTGRVEGDAVPQLYVSHPHSAVSRPALQLVGFERVRLRPGETRTVRMALPAARLAYWDAGRGAMMVEQETVRLMLGTSAAEMKLRTDLPVG